MIRIKLKRNGFYQALVNHVSCNTLDFIWFHFKLKKTYFNCLKQAPKEDFIESSLFLANAGEASFCRLEMRFKGLGTISKIKFLVLMVEEDIMRARWKSLPKHGLKSLFFELLGDFLEDLKRLIWTAWKILINFPE